MKISKPIISRLTCLSFVSEIMRKKYSYGIFIAPGKVLLTEK